MRTDVEFLVVGGGPVGTSVALGLHKAGREVLLVDAGGASEKVCGEGLLPPGWAALEALGVAARVQEKAPIEELSYSLVCPRSQRLRTLTAPLSRPSYGVRRDLLCRAFAEEGVHSGLSVWRPAHFRRWKLAVEGVSAEIECEGREQELRCRYLLAADGLHSRVRREAGLSSTKSRSFSRWGTRVYFRGPTKARVAVTLGDGVESYLTPLSEQLFGLAFLWSPEQLGRPLPGEGPIWRRLLQRFPASFSESLPLDTAFAGEKAIGPLQQLVSSPLHPSHRIALVGDASGYLDALTGEGLCLGMQQAEALVALCLEGEIHRYPAAHRAIKRRHQVVVHALLRLLAHESLKERVFSSLFEVPELFSSVVKVAVEHEPWHRLLRPDLARFLWHLVRG